MRISPVILFFELLGLFLGDGVVEGAGETHAQVDTDAIIDRGIHHGFVVIEIEVCEET